MQFHYTPGYGYYAASPYGYYGVAPGYGAWGADWSGVSGYAQDPMSGYAEPVAYYAEDYAEPPASDQWGEAEMQQVGYYADQQPVGYYADEQQVGYYADEQPAGYYAAVPEMVGWGEQESPVGYYSDAPLDGYVRGGRPRFNPGCPMPTNVAGYGDSDHIDGYARPSTVNARCESFKPQPQTTGELPETFKPLW